MLQFLNLLQSEVRELKRNGQSSHTTTVMLVGIPNSGKSALANSLHQIGRISAEGTKSLLLCNENVLEEKLEMIMFLHFLVLVILNVICNMLYVYLEIISRCDFLLTLCLCQLLITVEEKGRLKHAAVSPNPGETKEISSFKVQTILIQPFCTCT